MLVLLLTIKSALLSGTFRTNPLTRRVDDATSSAYEQRRISFFFHASSLALLSDGSKPCLLLLTLLPLSTSAIFLATCLSHACSASAGFVANHQCGCQALYDQRTQKSRSNQQPHLKSDVTHIHDAPGARLRDAHGLVLIAAKWQNFWHKMNHRHSPTTKLNTPKTPLTRTLKNPKMKTGVPLAEAPDWRTD